MALPPGRTRESTKRSDDSSDELSAKRRRRDDNVELQLNAYQKDIEKLHVMTNEQNEKIEELQVMISESNEKVEELQVMISAMLQALPHKEEEQNKMVQTSLYKVDELVILCQEAKRSMEHQTSLLAALPIKLCGAVKKGLSGFFATEGGSFSSLIENFTQKQHDVEDNAKDDTEDYPEDQRATGKDLLVEETLLKVALSLTPWLTPTIYASVMNAYGKRAKCLRVSLHACGKRRPSDPSEKPLRWTNTPNGGRQYVYLPSEKDIMKRAWKDWHFGVASPRVKSCAEMAKDKQSELWIKGIPLGEWTTSSVDLLLPDLSAPEE